MKRIETLLRQTIGLDAASIGAPLIHRTVRSRMRSIGIRKLDDYAELIQQSPAEWEELVESVLVSETWFFRDPEQIAFLVRHVLTEWLPGHRSERFRILSLPCSSGEEPYSLVMALRDAGLPANRLQIDAADISARALTRAGRGVYRKNSFRGQDLAFRDRYFQPCKEGFALDASIRESVHFSIKNLLSGNLVPRKESYDCIFCRNLLIYFDRATQKDAVARIEQLLKPGGILFVGPAEQPLLAGHPFISANAHHAFAFRKLPPHAPHTIVPRSHRLKPHKFETVARLAPASPRPRNSTEQPGSTAPPTGSGNLENARQLAEQGHLAEAAQICETHLRHRNDCAQAYYLLGLVRDAAGDERAVDCYRRALYLEPNHYESLLQMAMLSQRKGDVSRARTFKNRAQRVRNRL